MRFAHATGAFRLRYAARWERVAEVWRSVEVTRSLASSDVAGRYS